MKNIKIFYSVLLLFFMVVLFSSCKKDECKAGGGGNLTFIFTPKHHANPIPNCTVKIKFNAKNFPGENGSYDVSSQAAGGETKITVTGLKCGDYYFYATGIDSTLSDPDKTVKGGIPYSTNLQSGTIEIDIPVTESH